MAATTLVDRALIRLSGEDVRGFLQGLVTNDLDRWRPTGRSGPACSARRARPCSISSCGPTATTCWSIASATAPTTSRGASPSIACAGRSGSAAKKSCACTGRPDGDGPADPRLPALGRRWLAPRRRRRARAGWSTAFARRDRGRGRARPGQDTLARMQRQRAERRQLHQGLLCRPGEHRADELSQQGQPPAGGGADRRAGRRARGSTIRSSGWPSNTAGSTISTARSCPAGWPPHSRNCPRRPADLTFPPEPCLLARNHRGGMWRDVQGRAFSCLQVRKICGIRRRARVPRLRRRSRIGPATPVERGTRLPAFRQPPGVPLRRGAARFPSPAAHLA